MLTVADQPWIGRVVPNISALFVRDQLGMADAASKTHAATIIVSIVVIQDGKLLMMQEAKAGAESHLPGLRVPVSFA